MGSDKEKKLIDEAISRFPDTFGLRNFPDLKFRISSGNSYFVGPGECGGKMMLYTQSQRIVDGGRIVWSDFAKGTEEELRAQLVKLT